MTVHSGLSVGDSVQVVRQQGGQKYLVIREGGCRHDTGIKPVEKRRSGRTAVPLSENDRGK